ncbi:MAG: ABC transporter permease, partial [Candidatus Methylomirabilaceae bacterium]
GGSVGALSGLYRHGALIRNFVKRDLQARYRGSAIGLMWSVVHPLVMLGLYTYIFSSILRVRVGAAEGTGSFAIYLFCGLLPWNAFAEALNRSTGVVLEHANLIKRTIFPSQILPIYPVVSGIFNQLIGLGILLVALLVTSHPFSSLLLLLPAVLLFQFALTVGLAWIVAGLTVFVRDLGQLVGMVLTIWVFLTPIFYPPTLVPEQLRFLLAANPMYALVESYRCLILKGQLPPSADLAVLAFVALPVFVLGYWMFTRMQGAFADVI